MNLRNLFNTSRLFSARPPVSFQYGQGLYIYFSLMIVGCIVALLVSDRLLNAKARTLHRSFIHKIARYYMISAIIGIILVFARLQYIALFAMRFLLLGLILVQIGMIGYFVFEAKVEFPKYQKSFLSEMERQKYLPKRKKR